MSYKPKLSNQAMGNLSWLISYSVVPALNLLYGSDHPLMQESEGTLTLPPFGAPLDPPGPSH